jgi:hypothetical protein
MKTKGDLRQSVGKLLLYQLVCRQRLTELFPVKRVLARHGQTKLCRAQNTPRDTKSEKDRFLV